MIISVNCKNKRILIVGGGRCALRRTQAFLKEGAEITVASITIDESFHCLPVSVCEKAYEDGDMNEFDIVYAATNDTMVNECIMQEAKQKDILALSCEYHEEYPHLLMAYQQDTVQLAVSTNATYPALCKQLLTRMKQVWESEFQDKMKVLKQLRPLLLQYAATEDIIKQCSCYTQNQLVFLLHALQQGRALIYAFHGVKDEAIIYNEVLPFLKLMEDKQELPCGAAYLAPAVLTQVNKECYQIYYMFVNSCRLRHL